MPLRVELLRTPRRRAEHRSAGSGILDRSALLLLGWPFLLGLALLLLNDSVLKPALHDWMTGKLSDFAGLFVLPVLVVAITGWRPRVVCWGTAAAFVIWKSPLATPFIAAWNAHAPWRVARVVDYSDWIALVSVVLANAHVARRAAIAPTRSLAQAAGMVVAGVSLAGVVATSRAIRLVPLPEAVSAELPVTRAAIIDQLAGLGFEHVSEVYRARGDRRPFPVDTLDLWKPATAPMLRVELTTAPESRTLMRLIAATPWPDSAWRETARTMFERDLVDPLRRRFESHDGVVAGEVYHLRSINGRKLPVAVPDTDCGGRITAAEVEVRSADTLVVSVSRKGATKGCVWRSYAHLVRRDRDSTSAFVDLAPGVDAGVLLGAWRVIAVGPDLYLERVAGRPVLGVGTDLAFSR